MAISNENIDIKLEKKQDVLVIRLLGRLDAITAGEAEKRILITIDNGEKNLLLDFQHVEYISSAGMRVLLSIAKRLRGLSGKLVLCSINTRVMDILKMSGFDHVIDLQQDEHEALTKFR